MQAVLQHQPNVLVIDLEMPGMDGLDGLGAVAETRRTRPAQVFLMLTRHARPGLLRKALKLGVRGFVSKSAEPAHIASVIATPHQGKRWIDPGVSALAVIDDSPRTDREIDVLRATSDGPSVEGSSGRICGLGTPSPV
ncbi:response regulator transcription factor [Micromonosporaceae bacterium B7E4]